MGLNGYGMTYGGNDHYKTDISTLSSQEVDFLFQNSDLLVDFELEDCGNFEKRAVEGMKTFGEEGLYDAACQDGLRGSFPQQFMTPFSEDGVSHMNKNAEDIHPLGIKKKETRQFDDTSSWSTDHSEIMASDLYDATSENLLSLRSNNKSFKSTEDTFYTTSMHAHGSKEVRDTKDEPYLLSSVNAEDTLLTMSEGICCQTREGIAHRSKDGLDLEEEPKLIATPKLGNCTLGIEMFRNMALQNTQEKDMTRNGIKRAHAVVAMENAVKDREKELLEVKLADAIAMEKAVKGLDHELLELKKENKNLALMLKEHEHKMASFAKEKVLWEQKKVSEMNMFNTFKEAEVHKFRC